MHCHFDYATHLVGSIFPMSHVLNIACSNCHMNQGFNNVLMSPPQQVLVHTYQVSHFWKVIVVYACVSVRVCMSVCLCMCMHVYMCFMSMCCAMMC